MDKKWLIALIILIVLSLAFDNQITKLIASHRAPAMNNFMMWISYLGSIVVVFIVITSLFLWEENKRKWIPVLWLSVILTYSLVFIIKNVVMRARPELAPLVESFSEFSFPSGHAAIIFSTLAILIKEFRKLKYFWIVIAVLVCFSRVYLGVHFLTDVVAGALLGYFISLLSLELERDWKFSEWIFSILGMNVKGKKKRR